MTVSGFPEKRSLYFGSAEEKQDGRSKMDERARWNQAADHFQKIVDEKDEGYTNRLIEFLCEQEALKRGIRVADIGCGAGKYAVHFAKRGCGLLLVDFSENMMAYTKKNLSSYGIETEEMVCDWSAADIEKNGWKKSVDLAFASMTPAVSTEEDIFKLCEISRKYCFMSKFLSRKNLLFQEIALQCEIEEEQEKETSEELLRPLAYLLSLGYLPQIRCVPYGWENRYTPKEAETYLLNSNLGVSIREKGMEKELTKILKKLAEKDGCVKEKVEANAFWMLWETE